MANGSFTAADVLQSLYAKGNVREIENSAEIERNLAEHMRRIIRECKEKERKSIAAVSKLWIG